MTTILQFEWFIQIIEDDAIPSPNEYKTMILEELNSMAYTYNFGLTNRS